MGGCALKLSRVRSALLLMSLKKQHPLVLHAFELPLPFDPNVYNESDEGESCPVSKDDEPDHPDFTPHKKKRGKSKIPWDKNKKGFPDKKGNYWEPVPDGHKGTHDPHWDVQKPNGSHEPIYPKK